MNTLHLTLKKQWFEKIFADFKRTECREIKPYWLKRLFDCSAYSDLEIKGLCKTLNFVPIWMAKKILAEMEICPKEFKQVQFRNGYKSSSPVMIASGVEITISNHQDKENGTPEGNYIAIHFAWIEEHHNIPEYLHNVDPNLPF